LLHRTDASQPVQQWAAQAEENSEISNIFG
jgi:hypothetical protein